MIKTKMAFTLLWATALIAANQLLDGNARGQYAATFLLGGVYALALTKIKSLQSKRAVREASK
ncbi:hypothetical protein HYE82_34460 [Streptomyces sp. BR123]|uniref:hypothetical protein n=1 Tax=Streptomyces sp. BR123 TaxID=2749828 RepID=UPI0015C47ACC|nr:hypothetical protein [Streptomyces sp. BR123]NXY99388.1 hypothetical protein [Streptomyces sp. BR123]